MMSRLAIYPLAASLVLLLGRKGIGRSQLILGSVLVLLPFFSLLWSTSLTGGIPSVVRWASFGLMIMGFSGSVGEYGVKAHIPGLTTAAAVTSLVIIIFGPDTVTGNANRAGMILALGFTGSLFLARGRHRFFLLLPVLILAGAYISSFYICWVACAAGAAGYLIRDNDRFNWRMILTLMIAGQIAVSLFPSFAGRIGPTLELRTRIWSNSAGMFVQHMPMGTGFGSARLSIFNSAEPELRTLAGESSRIDYLHSEPLTLITETGISGLLVVGFILYLLYRKSGSIEVSALTLAFWPVFTADLPLATPLGALPAALFLGLLSSSNEHRVHIPVAVPVLLAMGSIWWGFLSLTGYRALADHMSTGSTDAIEKACSRIPWEERAFLAAGYSHLAQQDVLAALENAEKFIHLYPFDSRGWELKALSLSAAGRKSNSSWARAALLIPSETFRPDRYLMIINAIDTNGMDPDSALMLSSVLNTVFEERIELQSLMSPEERLSVSEKLLYLTDICRGLERDEMAAGIWVQALKFAVLSDAPVPSETGIGILLNAELKELLQWELEEKADEYLLLFEEKLGMGTL